MDIDSKEALYSHENIIRTKSFLNRIYFDFYNYLKHAKAPRGKIVEIGSGAGFIKEVVPKIVTSDVIDGPQIDKVFSASKIPFADKSISAFFMFDVFHHIKDPEKALYEMERCLKKNGKIIMIEPYPSLFGSFIYKYIHPERDGFNMKSGWKIPGKGRMSDANPAIPWIIFVRDIKIFKTKFPTLKVQKIKPHTPFKYLIAGGLSKYQLLPVAFYGIINSIEKAFSGLNKHIGMFVTIEIKKT